MTNIDDYVEVSFAIMGLLMVSSILLANRVSGLVEEVLVWIFVVVLLSYCLLVLWVMIE